MKLANNFEEILIAFNACRVDYIIAGGLLNAAPGAIENVFDFDIEKKSTWPGKSKALCS